MGIWDLGFGIQLVAPSSLPAPALPPLASFQGFRFSPTLQDGEEKGGFATGNANRWKGLESRGEGSGETRGGIFGGWQRHGAAEVTPPSPNPSSAPSPPSRGAVPADPTAPLSHPAPQFPAPLPSSVPIPAQSSRSVLGEPLERPGHLRVPHSVTSIRPVPFFLRR